jgi:hypothetical protein
MSIKNDQNAFGFRERDTARNFVSWLLLKSHNTFLHLEKCHYAKIVSWLVKKMTTTHSGITKIPQFIVVVAFYGHNAMCDKV